MLEEKLHQGTTPKSTLQEKKGSTCRISSNANIFEVLFKEETVDQL